MTTANQVHCGRCGDRIFWHKTTKGKMMPLNPGANANGNCFINADGLLEVLGKNDERRTNGTVTLLSPHWATCRNPPGRAKT